MTTQKPVNLRFSKPPPSATRPPLRVLKPLENHAFPVNSQNAVGAVGAADSGSRRYKKADNTFTKRSRLTDLEWLGLLAVVAWPLILILLATQLPDFHCKPGDVTTTNGRPVCKASAHE